MEPLYYSSFIKKLRVAIKDESAAAKMYSSMNQMIMHNHKAASTIRGIRDDEIEHYKKLKNMLKTFSK